MNGLASTGEAALHGATGMWAADIYASLGDSGNTIDAFGFEEGFPPIPAITAESDAFADCRVTRSLRSSSTANDYIDDVHSDSAAHRMAELEACAREEGIKVSPASRADLQRFLGTHRSARSPLLYLLENGNFRAMWRNGRGEQIGLQFLGEGQIQYVIFALSETAPRMERSWGRGSFRHIEQLLGGLGLRRLFA